MKKHVFFAAFLLISLASYAQIKGDRYVSGSLTANCGNQTITLKEGAFSYTESQPLETTLGIAAEYGFFAENNLRIGVSFGGSWGSSPIANSIEAGEKYNLFAVSVNPSLAYYIRLTDNLYYTPELGIALERGTLSEQKSKDKNNSLLAWGWDAYVHLLSFEFKVSEKIALGATIGSISYGNATFTNDNDKNNRSEILIDQFKCSMNESSIYFRFYY